jgi:hypothetical protein
LILGFEPGRFGSAAGHQGSDEKVTRNSSSYEPKSQKTGRAINPCSWLRQGIRDRTIPGGAIDTGITSATGEAAYQEANPEYEYCSIGKHDSSYTPLATFDFHPFSLKKHSKTRELPRKRKSDFSLNTTLDNTTS